MSLLTGHRITGYQVTLLDRYLSPRGLLDGVKPGGSLEWSMDRSVLGTGSLVVTGQNIDWSSARLAISTTVSSAFDPLSSEGATSWSLGVWIPVVPGDDWTDTGRTQSLQLLDLSSILDRSGPVGSFSVGAGTNITDLVKLIVVDRGLRSSVTDSAATLQAGLVWDPNTTWLQVCNDLLKVIRYRPIWADRFGIIRVEPDTAPGTRALAWEFVSGQNCIHGPTWSMKQDRDSVPTKMVLVMASTDTTPAIVGEYQPPASSQWSSTTRGYEYQITEDAEGTSKPELDAMAQARWVALSTPPTTREITHAPIPLNPGSAVRFASPRAGVDARHVVAKTTVTLDETALQATTLQEVAS